MRIRQLLLGLILSSLPFTVLTAGATPCRPNDGACQPKPCKVNAKVSEDGSITLGSPLIECYY